MSNEWKELAERKDSGLYIISTDTFIKHGIVKVGIATRSSFEKRFKSYRGCYGMFEKIHIFCLAITDKKTATSTEKRLLKEFQDVRIPYYQTDSLSEFCIVKVDTIKKVVKRIEKYQHVEKVISFMDELSKIHITDLDLTIKRKSGKFYEVEYPDGFTTRILGDLLMNTVNVPPLKDWAKIYAHYQEEFDEIIKEIARTKTAGQIKKEARGLVTNGDIGDIALSILKERIIERGKKEAEERFKRR